MYRDISRFPPNFNVTFKYSYFPGAKFFFCKIPEGRAISINDADVFQSLNLPNNTILSGKLRKSGECLAKAVKIKEDETSCSCDRNLPFIVLIFISVLSFFVSLIQSIKGPPSSFKAGFCSNFSTLWAALYFFVLLWATVKEWLFYETIYLPNSIDYQIYLKTPSHWWWAIGFGFGFCLLSIAESQLIGCIVEDLMSCSMVSWKFFSNLSSKSRIREKQRLEKYMINRKLAESRFTSVLVPMNTWP